MPGPLLVSREDVHPTPLTNQSPSLMKDTDGSRKLAFIPSQVTEKEPVSPGMPEEPEVGRGDGMQRGSRRQLERTSSWRGGTFHFALSLFPDLYCGTQGLSSLLAHPLPFTLQAAARVLS